MIVTLFINDHKEQLECQPGEMLTEVLRNAGHVEVKKAVIREAAAPVLSFLRVSPFFHAVILLFGQRESISRQSKAK